MTSCQEVQRLAIRGQHTLLKGRGTEQRQQSLLVCKREALSGALLLLLLPWNALLLQQLLLLPSAVINGQLQHLHHLSEVVVLELQAQATPYMQSTSQITQHRAAWTKTAAHRLGPGSL